MILDDDELIQAIKVGSCTSIQLNTALKKKYLLREGLLDKYRNEQSRTTFASVVQQDRIQKS